jgi:hypothetical protein
MNQNIAYLSQGKLHFKNSRESVRVIESKFGQNVRDRAIQIQQRNAWKSQGRGARFMAGGLVWGEVEHDPASMRITITSLSRGFEPGDLLYALETDEIAGIFNIKNSTGDEKRIFHSADFRVRHLSAKPGEETIACALVGGNGTSNIAVMRTDGSEFSEVTEGDSLDLAPRWIPDSSRRLVFQSAGIGRDSSGNFSGHGPFSIQKLDLDTGEMTSLAEEENYDLLGPQMNEDGVLYYIRRPYQKPGDNFSFPRAILDTLLFPIRIFYAIFQWLNFFTVRYTGKPLNTAQGAKQRNADLKQMMIWGNLIDAGKAAKQDQFGDQDAPSLVPQSWQLVRHRSNGSTEVIAKGVLSFDLCEDGSIVYSNGSAIYRIDPKGSSERLHVDSMIEQVIMV